MPKLILRSNYFKNTPAVHKSNYIKYLGTREGVEFNPDTLPRFFYEDMDMHGRKENYIEYISDRPGAVHIEGTPHGLFSNKGLDINLEQVMDEVAHHEGMVWINVISLKREDAARLGYDAVDSWQAMIRSHVPDISEAFKIKPDDLRWYAAFHNEGHHPHIHMVVYSKGEEGYLSKGAIKKLKSKITNDIFRYELSNLYEQKTAVRNDLKEQAKISLLSSICRLNGASSNQRIDFLMNQLGKSLAGIKGKKVYGYLHKNIKFQVDEIVKELSQIPEVNECYRDYMKHQLAIKGYYEDNPVITTSLIDNKEFHLLRNMVIKEAIRLYESSEQANSVSAVSRLLKELEKLFTAKSGLGHMPDVVKEAAHISSEREKKIALGQKADDSEKQENMKYMSM